MKVYAFYLPQFHKVPENDKWWGEDYTEWTAVKGGVSFFDGHNQPQEPLNDNYYNLLERDSLKWQSDLMKAYGIDGMCFYHYWFGDGKQVLEKPAEKMLEWHEIKMPFCFAWANESWVSSWGSEEGFPWKPSKRNNNEKQHIIFEQKYGREEEWDKHLKYLIRFFNDFRYIKVQGKPLLVIYRPDLVPCLEQMLYYWRERIVLYNFPGIYVVGCGCADIKYGVDAYITHEPANVRTQLGLKRLDEAPIRYSYNEACEKILNQKGKKGTDIIFSTFCSYDNTPRYGRMGCVFDSTPKQFENHLSRLMAKNAAANMDFMFVDAWNEWGEGMHLEPDKKNGYKWLEAVRNAKKTYLNYLDDFDNDNIRSEWEEKILSEKKKMSLYYNITLQWMELKNAGVCLKTWFEEKCFNKIMIYGFNPLVKSLLLELNSSEIEVCGIIDQNPNNIDCNIACYNCSEKLPDYDAIVVGAFYYMNEIYYNLCKNQDYSDVYSISEIIYDCRKYLH